MDREENAFHPMKGVEIRVRNKRGVGLCDSGGVLDTSKMRDGDRLDIIIDVQRVGRGATLADLLVGKQDGKRKRHRTDGNGGKCSHIMTQVIKCGERVTLKTPVHFLLMRRPLPSMRNPSPRRKPISKVELKIHPQGGGIYFYTQPA